MAKYNTFKYTQAKYGHWSTLSTPLKLKDTYRINNIVNQTIKCPGAYCFRARSNISDNFIIVNTVPIRGPVNKVRIKSDKCNTHTIAERRSL